MRLWKKIGIVGVVTLAAMQLTAGTHTNPPVVADLNTGTATKDALRRACYDCHSNETTWPWYSRVAPVSWLIQRDVSQGRAALNFSAWESLPADRRATLKRECREEIVEGEMPPWAYTPLHPNAALSGPDTESILSWTTGDDGPTQSASERH